MQFICIYSYNTSFFFGSFFAPLIVTFFFLLACPPPKLTYLQLVSMISSTERFLLLKPHLSHTSLACADAPSVKLTTVEPL